MEQMNLVGGWSRDDGSQFRGGLMAGKARFRQQQSALTDLFRFRLRLCIHWEEFSRLILVMVVAFFVSFFP